MVGTKQRKVLNGESINGEQCHHDSFVNKLFCASAEAKVDSFQIMNKTES